MKRKSLLPIVLGLAALAFHTSCKPKPVASAEPSPTPEAVAESTPAAATASVPTTQPESTPLAPQGNAGGNRPGGGQGNFQQRAEERMQRMKTDLGLSDDQAQKIRAIMEEQFGALRQQMGDSSISREQRRANFDKARAAANVQIEQILTPEQKPKWEAYQKDMEQRRAQRQQGGGNN